MAALGLGEEEWVGTTPTTATVILGRGEGQGMEEEELGGVVALAEEVGMVALAQGRTGGAAVPGSVLHERGSKSPVQPTGRTGDGPGETQVVAVTVVRREELPRMLSRMAGHPRRWLTYGSDTERLLSISCVLRTLASEPRMSA